MPEMTKERLAEIEARAVDPTDSDWRASRCGHNFPIRECMAKTCLARDARIDSLLLIARVRELEAENERLRRRSAEAYQMTGNSDYPIGYMDNFLALAEGEQPPHDWRALMEEDHTVRAKIESAWDGGER